MTTRQLSIQAMKEFAQYQGTWYTDACEVNSELMALAAVGAEPETLQEQGMIRARQIARGWFTPHGGATLQSMVNDLTTYERSVKIVQYVPWAQPGNWYGALLPALKTYAGVYPCAIEVGQAHNLTGNEGGVFWHFVVIAGYDDVRDMWLLLNGDDVRALGSSGQTYYPGRWITTADLVSANVAGLVVLRKVSNNVGIPTGWKDDGKTLTAPNGIEVTLGFRATVLSNTWQAENVPLAAAEGANPCDPTNPASGEGTNQLFSYLLLYWHEGTNTIGVRSAGEVAAYLKAHSANPPTPTPAPDPIGQQFIALVKAAEAEAAK